MEHKRPEDWDEMTAAQRGRWEDASGLLEEQVEIKDEPFDDLGIAEEP